MLFLRQLIFPFQTDSYMVSSSKLNFWNCVKTKINKSAAPPQCPNKQATIFWTPSRISNHSDHHYSYHTFFRET